MRTRLRCGRAVNDRHMDCPLAADDLDCDVVLVAADAEIDTSPAEAHVAQNHPIEKGRQSRVAQANLAPPRVEFQSERGLKQEKWGPARPSLRRTGDRIERWAAASSALKSAEELRQPAQLHVGGAIE